MGAVDASDALARGRDAYRRRAWGEAYRLLTEADRATRLAPEDRWSLASAAQLSGRDDEAEVLLEGTQRAFLAAGETTSAARCAFWLGFHLADRGKMAQASGWFGRAHRLVEQERSDCVERGYLLLPEVQRRLATGENEASYAAAEEAAEIGKRYGDEDLHALALHGQGRARLRQGRLDDGFALLDEAMVAVTADELSPMVTGVIYCSVIGGCHEVYALRRAHEWTAALARWCDRQPDLVAFSGQCLIHRSQVLQHGGDWRGALEEARHARERAERGEPPRVVAAAWYQQGELHRLLGEHALAEDAYRRAGQLGRDPHPGLALLWWAKGDTDAATASLRRMERETKAPLKRARVLPPYVEFMLATGQLDEAQRALHDLQALAEGFPAEALSAIVRELRGALALSEGDAPQALGDLREACLGWQRLEAPFETARVRWRIAGACRAVGDEATADLELEAARTAFRSLGAAAQLRLLEEEGGAAGRDDRLGLTARELQVLRMLAAGNTNRSIADELAVSRRTIDRHVSNIFDKLGVSTRAAATAVAYQHRLV